MCLLLFISLTECVHAEGEHQHEPIASEQVGAHQHDGMATPSILTGGVTLLALLFTFSLGFLGRRGIIRFNLKLHSLGAYTTIAIAIVHVVVNLLTH
jgi:hypothetical protein